TRIDPPVTTLPSNRFTPRRCELLSRPLRELPCPFFVAMMLRLELEFLDTNPRQRAAMPLGPAHALAALLLEHPDLRSARLAVDHAEDLHVGHERRAGENLAAVFFEKQDAIDGHFVARLGVKAVDFDEGPRRDLHLTAAAFND